MKKFISIILILSLISLISCTDQSAKIYSENMGSANQSEEDENTVSDEGAAESTLSGTLKISSSSQPEYFYPWANTLREFNKVHPNVVIEYNDTAVPAFDLSPEEYMLALEKYEDDLGVNMVAGNPLDLIINSKDYTSQFVPSGIIYDLYEFIENDPEFIKEHYFMNILEQSEIKGGLYVLPTEIIFESVRIRSDVLEYFEIDENNIETVDYKFMYDLYFKTVESGAFPEIKYMVREEFSSKAVLLDEEYAAAYDPETMTVNFETPEFIEYLETTKKFDAVENPFQLRAAIGDIGVFATDDYLFEISQSVGQGAKFYMGEMENATRPFPLVSSTGQLVPTVFGGISIPKNAENAELAWEFIKFYIGETEEANYYDEEENVIGTRSSGAIFINRELYKVDQMNVVIQELVYRGINEEEVTYTVEEIEGLISYVENALAIPLTLGITDVALNSTLREIQFDYYSDLMTAEECAKAMQDRAEIYFAEIE